MLLKMKHELFGADIIELTNKRFGSNSREKNTAEFNYFIKFVPNKPQKLLKK